MPYTPTSADIDQAEKELAQEKNITIPDSNMQPNSGVSLIPQHSTQNYSSIFSGPTTLNSVASSPGIQGILGAGDALRNTISSGLNAIPGVNIPASQNGQGGAYGAGNILGNLAGFMGGGEVLDTARAAAEAIPYIGKLAQMLGGSSFGSTAARQGLGTGLYGAIASPQDRTDNAVMGASLGSTAAALPFGAGKIAQGLGYLQPQKYSKEILDNLSGGQSLGDATQSVLEAVKNSYKQQSDDASELYNGVRNNIPSGSIYAPLKGPLGIPSNLSFSDLEGSYPSISQGVTDNYTSALKDMHNDFINSPTFQNAHALQSELGTVSRQLQSGRMQMSSTLDSSSLNKARNALKSDMDTYLSAQSPDLANQYRKAAQSFQQNVVPYRTDPEIYSIATGDTTNVPPSALGNIFKAPDTDMQKVINDLPSGTMDKVLYTQLGKDTPANNPFAFARAYGRLNEKGLGDYISPELQQNLDSLQNRIKWRSLAQSGAGGLLAAAKGGAHGASGAVGMGMAGAAIASPLMNYLGRRLPLDQIGNAVSSASSASYPYLYQTALSNLLNKTGGQN